MSNIAEFTVNTTIGQFISAEPGLMSLFQKYDLDCCCGGQTKLADACAEKGLDPQTVLTAARNHAAPQAAAGKTPAATGEWTSASLKELTGHLEKTHHAYLRAAQPRIAGLMAKVLNAHAANHPDLKQLAASVQEFWDDMMPHLMKEENILFPIMRSMEESGEAEPCIPGPIHVMRMEHDKVGQIMQDIQTRSNNFTPPEDACMTYRALLKELDQLLDDTYVHIHLENNILFVKAAAFGS